MLFVYTYVEKAVGVLDNGIFNISIGCPEENACARLNNRE
jgi:hypothetical protein